MEDDSEARLSFSDLLFLTDALPVESKVISLDENENDISSSSSSNQDFLGFFSEEWGTTTGPISSNKPERIIFFGRVIDTSRNDQNPNPKKKTNSKKKNERWNSDSFSKRSSIHFSSTTRSESLSPGSGRKKDDHNKSDSRSKVLACSSSKSRWQVFMFGSDRFPTKTKLSDIRSRQLMRSHGVEEEKSGGMRLPGLIRVLGCGGGFTDKEMIKSSIG